MRCGKALALALVVAACAGPAKRPPATAGAGTAKVKIGQPYQVLGQWYYPKDDRNYDVTGVASWYGPGFHGLATASGERFDQDDVSAAHTTLPLPSYVEVTNLENGRTLTLRINDRGPFVGNRIIDLSRRSAQLLGVERAGTAKVRVRRVYPGAPVRVALQPPPNPPSPPAIVVLPAPAASVGTVFVQVAALSDQGRAEWLRGYLAPFGATRIEPSGAGLWRVRIGPFASRDTATAVLAQVRTAGYTDARIVVAAPGG